MEYRRPILQEMDTQCLQKMELFSAISLKNVSFAAVIE